MIEEDKHEIEYTDKELKMMRRSTNKTNAEDS